MRSPCLAVVAVAAALTLSAATAALAADAQVAFGTQHAVALRTNGEVVTWGHNVGCQLGRRAGNHDPNPGLVMRNARQVAAASEHTLVLTEEGRVYGWGTNGEGALGTGDAFDKCEGPVLVHSLAGKTITQIATGYDFSVALTSTGDLYCAGDNSMGQCAGAKGFTGESFTPVTIPALAGRVVAIKAGGFHTLALTIDGTLYAFGRGRDGQLGNGKTVNGVGAVELLTGVTSFGAGTWHSVALRNDGTVWTWGNNSRSQLCDGGTSNRNVPGEIVMAGGAKAAQVAAGSHGTVVRTVTGALVVCGDNAFGQLGVEGMTTVPTPTVIAGAAATSTILATAGYLSAFSADGCTLRVAGRNESGLLSPGQAATPKGFFARQAPSLCAPKTAAPAGDIVNPAPSGGESGCWSQRREEDASTSPKFAALRQSMLSAETLLKNNKDFMAALEPVRMRTSLSAGPYAESGARMHVKVVPERKQDGSRIWAAGCDVIPQLDRIGGAIAQVSIFFNVWQDQFVGNLGTPPKLTGTVGGYPEYNYWVRITEDGRLPWIPATLDDKLAEIGARREKALEDWKANRNGMAAMPNVLTQREKEVSDYKAYRASFTAEQLRMPGVWGDASGAGRKQLEARINALQALTPAEQQQADTVGREARDLERQAQAESRSKNVEEAARLRTRSNELGLQVRAIRKNHMEAAVPSIQDAQAQYDLTNLRPGPADQAMNVKPDPAAVAASSDPSRIHVIALSFSVDGDPKNVERRAWQLRFKESFDFAALAALLR